MNRTVGKVALVTGGARGIGAAVVRQLVAEGSKVVITDVLVEQGRALAEELGDDTVFIRHDVTSRADWQQAVALAEKSFGGLDVLVNNAGIADFGTVEDFGFDQWDRIIAINLTSAFVGIKTALPLLKTSEKNASIINISSTAGLQGYEALSGYVASKWGLRGMTKSMALDLGPANIRVNSVHPGAIKTPMTEGLELAQTHVALKRLGLPQEIAHLVVFLASDESTFSTGGEFIADGGETAGLAH